MSQSVAALVHGFASHDPRHPRRRRGPQPGRQPRPRAAAPRGAGPARRAGPRRAPARRPVRLAGPPPRPRAGGRARHRGRGVARRPRRADRRPLRPGRHRRARRGSGAARGGAAAAARARAGPAGARSPSPAGPAFSFTYPDNLEALAAAGAELVPFDPCRDACLPEACAGLIAGGGLPRGLRRGAGRQPPDCWPTCSERVGPGLVTWAECGGLLWLCDDLDGQADGRRRRRSGDDDRPRLTLGYRVATATAGHAARTGRHRAAGPRVPLLGHRAGGRALRAHRPPRRSAGGFGGSRLVASYLHVHLAGRGRDVAQTFVRSCSALCLPYLD